MFTKQILTELDAEIARLRQARALLTDTPQPTGQVMAVPAKKKRKMTPEGRARIAEAVKRRWAKQKKAAQGK